VSGVITNAYLNKCYEHRDRATTHLEQLSILVDWIEVAMVTRGRVGVMPRRGVSRDLQIISGPILVTHVSHLFEPGCRTGNNFFGSLASHLV
jgi:hypothetical protein